MSFLYNTLIYKPLYNGLIYLMDVLPWIDAGLAIVIFTIIVRTILFPLSKKSVTTQLKMRKLQPELNALKDKHKDDRQAYAQKTLELYRNNKINPFAGIALVLIQLPIIFALYHVFTAGFEEISADLLYSFVKIPEMINTQFLGLVDISGKSLVLAILAGASSYFQIKYSVPKVEATQPREKMSKEERFRHDLTRSMSLQMRYMLPAIAFFVSWTISGAIAVYWITSNLFTIAQELYIRKSISKSETISGTQKVVPAQS